MVKNLASKPRLCPEELHKDPPETAFHWLLSAHVVLSPCLIVSDVPISIKCT